MNVRLTDQEELNNYLTYGKWDLDEKQIERLHKDEEMKQRVRVTRYRANIIQWSTSNLPEA